MLPQPTRSVWEVLSLTTALPAHPHQGHLLKGREGTPVGFVTPAGHATSSNLLAEYCCEKLVFHEVVNCFSKPIQLRKISMLQGLASTCSWKCHMHTHGSISDITISMAESNACPKITGVDPQWPLLFSHLT